MMIETSGWSSETKTGLVLVGIRQINITQWARPAPAQPSIIQEAALSTTAPPPLSSPSSQIANFEAFQYG